MVGISHLSNGPSQLWLQHPAWLMPPSPMLPPPWSPRLRLPRLRSWSFQQPQLSLTPLPQPSHTLLPQPHWCTPFQRPTHTLFQCPGPTLKPSHWECTGPCTPPITSVHSVEELIFLHDFINIILMFIIRFVGYIIIGIIYNSYINISLLESQIIECI